MSGWSTSGSIQPSAGSRVSTRKSQPSMFPPFPSGTRISCSTTRTYIIHPAGWITIKNRDKVEGGGNYEKREGANARGREGGRDGDDGKVIIKICNCPLDFESCYVFCVLWKNAIFPLWKNFCPPRKTLPPEKNSCTRPWQGVWCRYLPFVRFAVYVAFMFVVNSSVALTCCSGRMVRTRRRTVRTPCWVTEVTSSGVHRRPSRSDARSTSPTSRSTNRNVHSNSVHGPTTIKRWRFSC